MTHSISIDLETLGTNVDSQILQIGACIFNEDTGEINDTIELNIEIDQDAPINCTIGTIQFWLNQPDEVFKATRINAVSLADALLRLSSFISSIKPITSVWANGTKFDLGMLEYQYKQYNIPIPWCHNDDRCMRTLRQLVGPIDIPSTGMSHTALSDAIWQAKYISAALNRIFIE